MTAILHAPTSDGEMLPILDLTNPAFAFSISDAALALLAEQYAASAAQREVPPQVQAALAQSRLGQGLMAAAGGFLDGLTTYLLKVGPENLPDTVHPIDRRIAASFPAVTSRLRVQDMTELLADGVRDRLIAAPRVPLHMINIAGGPAADSWNALIKLAASGVPLRGRDISITVMDIDTKGPAFGLRAVHALESKGAPLEGLNIQFEHVNHNWSDTETLGRTVNAILPSATAGSAVCAVSSEGGLFEYGSDADISGTLATLLATTAADTIIVGSVTRKSELTQAHGTTRIAIRPRTRDEFTRLVEDNGWRIDVVIERPLSDHVRLIRAS